MKIVKLDIKNFMAVGDIPDLPLNDKGLILIQGNNEDDTSQASNGAGKSTIAEALCWAFYGETARGESGDSVVNRTAKKGTSVIVELIDDDSGETYRVSRYRKHKTYKNMLRLEVLEGESWKDLTKGTDKLTQEAVNKVIGCTHEVFASAIYAGQEAMPDLPGMTDKQLKVLVEEAAGINQLQQAFDVARRKQSEAKLALSEASGKVGSTQGEIARLEGALVDFKDKYDQADKRIKLDIEVAEKNLADATAAFDDTLEAKIVAKIGQLQNDIQEMSDKIAGSDNERAEEARLVRESNTAENQFNQAKRDYERALLDAQNAKHAYDHADSKVGSSCGECGHVIEAADVAGAKEAARENAVKKAQHAQKLKEAMKDAQKRAVSASDALAHHRSTMTDVSALAASQRDLSEKLNKLQDAKRNQAEKKRNLGTLQTKLDEARKAENPHGYSVKKTEDDLNKARESLKDLTAKQAEAQAALDVAEEAVRVFGPAGVRAHILDTVTPYLNSRTSHYLAALTDGNITAVWSTISATAKGELREKFSIDVASATGAESFKGLSGGEKRKVRLACAMALQDLVSSRATKPIKLFIADEIDHALDPAGLERLMTILEEKSHDKGTVLVISHTNLTDWIRTSITVTKKGGQSYLEPVCL